MKKEILIKGIENIRTNMDIQIDDINDNTIKGTIKYINTVNNALDVLYITVKTNISEYKFFERDIISFENDILEVVGIKKCKVS